MKALSISGRLYFSTGRVCVVMFRCWIVEALVEQKFSLFQRISACVCQGLVAASVDWLRLALVCTELFAWVPKCENCWVDFSVPFSPFFTTPFSVVVDT